MGFFSNLFRDRAADEAKRKELAEFTAGMRAMDRDALLRLAGLVAYAEKALAAEKHIVPGRPAEAVELDRNLCLDVSRIVRAIRRGHPEDADGYVVWLLTFRAAQDASLKDGVVEIWRMLGEAAPEAVSFPEGYGPRA